MKILIPLLLLLLLCSCNHEPACESVDLSVPYKTSWQIDTLIKNSDKPWVNQLAAWEYSYIGEYQKMAETWDKDRPQRQKLSPDDSTAFFQTYQPQDAFEYIVKNATQHQVVMINEAHHQPIHRVFTASLLQAFYDRGFRYLGLEALDHNDTELNTRKYPVKSSGAYIVEPQFGNLVREALAIGYELFPYESQNHSDGTNREINQAKNIQAFVEAHPEGKVLIHAGFAHIIEGDYKAWGKAMAGRFKEFTGIDPYTINQNTWTQSAYESYNDSYYQVIQEKESSVFIDENDNPFTHPNKPDWYDLRIFHPRWQYTSGRPDWLMMKNGKTIRPIKLPQINFPPPYLIMAYTAEEDIQSGVPVDIIEWGNGKEAPALVLPEGDFQIVVKGKDSTSCVFTIKI